MRIYATALFLYVIGACAQTGSTIEGTVISSATHAGIPGVSVSFSDEEGASYNATTDTDGKFRITGVEPGEYRARYDKSGFVQVELPLFGQPPLRVGATSTVRADVELSPRATVRGRVLDPEGKPAATVTVEMGIASVETNADGRFELKGVRPGTYTLRASAKAEQARQEQIVPTYYPSTANLSDAERILVRAGADLAGYEIRLQTSPVFHVSGIVLDENGKPAAKANVKLLIPGERKLLAGRGITGEIEFYLNLPSMGRQEAAVVSREDGTFEFPAVRPGNWNLSAESSPQQEADHPVYFLASGMVQAPVSDHDLEDVQLRFGPNFSVSVAADWGDQKPPANYLDRLPSVMLVPAPGMRQALQMFMPAQRAPAEKVAFQHMVPGRYRIVPRPGVPAGFYVAAIMLGGHNVLEEEVELTSATPEIHIIYKPNPGRITGAVDHGEGATVLLWPNSGALPPAVRFARVDAHGEFAFSNVAPGDYSLVAFDRIDEAGGSDSFVLGAVAAGKRVTIQESGSESVQLTVTHWPD